MAAEKTSDKYTIAFERDGIKVRLSYKGLGATVKTVVAEIDNKLRALETALYSGDAVSELTDFFSMVGNRNAMTLITAYCSDAFIAFWTKAAMVSIAVGFAYSSRSILQLITKTKFTLSGYEGNLLVAKMNDIVASIKCKQLPIPSSEELSAVAGLAFKTVANGDITVAFRHKDNNVLHFMVNNELLSYCTKGPVKEISTASVMNACFEIRTAIFGGEDLKPVISRWSASFVFRVMQILCEEESYSYFRNLVLSQIQKGEKPITRKILKDLGYTSHDRDTKAFATNILAVLEETINSQSFDRNHNAEQLERNDIWNLQFYENGAIHYRKMDFTKITSDSLRGELIAFLRITYADDLSAADCGQAVTQTARYLSALCTCLNYLSNQGITHFEDLDVMNADALMGHLKSKGASVNQIAESMLYLAKLFDVITYDQFIPNPFDFTIIPDRRRATVHVEPLSDKAAMLIEINMDKLPPVVAAAYTLLRATGGRARDMLMLPRSALITYFDGRYAVKYLSSKTEKQNEIIIEKEAAQTLFQYITKTQALRSQIDSDAIFVYQPQYRDNSLRKPRILTADTFNWHISKLLGSLGVSADLTCTPRKIRAKVGSSMFAQGSTPIEVADKLGNSQLIAMTNYCNLSIRERAVIRSKLYSESMAYLLPENRNAHKAAVSAINAAPYGKCAMHDMLCANRRVCSDCKALTTPRKEKI